MRKTAYITIMAAICATMALTSCNDEWEDELYEHLISFKAPVGSNGVCDIYMRYQEDGSGQYLLPVIVSGTTTNQEDYDIKIAVDYDTLAILNSEKFASGREDLWYQQLPDEYFSFPSETCHIPAGSDTETFTIDFDLEGLDLSENWVLPLTIVEDDSYKINIRKGWYKALLGINLFNDYSGTYSSTTMNVYIDGTTNDPAVADERYCKVVNDTAVFFYAGTIWDEDVNRSLYKVVVTFEEGTEDDDGAITGNVTLSSGDEENAMELETTGDCYYYYTASAHSTKPYIEVRLTTLYLDYTFTDSTTSPEVPIRYNVTGSMTMERDYNTLIPDEDQAVLW